MSMQGKLLEEMNKISELCSEIESSGKGDSVCDLLDTDSESFAMDNGEERFVNRCRGRKKMKLIPNSEDELEENDQNIESLLHLLSKYHPHELLMVIINRFGRS